MQNIQDLKEKIFFESKNIIDILEKINNVEELISKQDLVNELANRISFLRLFEKNIEYFMADNLAHHTENQQNISFVNNNFNSQESNNEGREEEAVFNNMFNEIDENEKKPSDNEDVIRFFDNKKAQHEIINEEEVFNNQLNEINENELSDDQGGVLSFIDEERILADAEPETNEDIHEEIFSHHTTEEEVIFNNQLNEIDEFENEVSDDQGNELNNFEEEEKIQNNFEADIKEEEENLTKGTPEIIEFIPNIFENEILEDNDDEMLIEENEDQYITSKVKRSQSEIIKDEKTEEIDKRKIVNIDKPFPEVEQENLASDVSFENLDVYNQEKKIRLANIKGLKAVQSLFDDDPLERDTPKEKPVNVVKEAAGSILKTNIPTNFMEAERAKPDFKLDLNDRIAFTKMLFAGSQAELNQVIGVLNRFATLEEAKEYLSDLYYERKWSNADEYAQRLWILVENKFL